MKSQQYIPKTHELITEPTGQMKELARRKIIGMSGPYDGAPLQSKDTYYNVWYFLWDTKGLSKTYIKAVSQDLAIWGRRNRDRMAKLEPEPDHLYMVALEGL